MTITLNPFRRLLDLLPSEPLRVGDVAATHDDGTATVVLADGGQVRVRNPQEFTVGARVFTLSGEITGPAPVLPSVVIDI